MRNILGWQIALVVATAFLAFLSYLALMPGNVTAVSLNIHVDCANGNETKCALGSDTICLQDSDLEQSPKLKDALAASLKAPYQYGTRTFDLVLTPAEFEAVNRMFINADTDAARSYAPDKELNQSDPTHSLWPRDTSMIYVGYNGSTYHLFHSYFVTNRFAPWTGYWNPS